MTNDNAQKFFVSLKKSNTWDKCWALGEYQSPILCVPNELKIK